MFPQPRTFAVLIADDSEADRFLLRHALRSHPRLNVIGEVIDGEEAIAYLTGEGRFSNREAHPFPDLLLLDLQMPCKSGFEVLHWLQTQPPQMPATVVVSASTLPEDHERSLALGAIAFHSKPANKEGRNAILASIEKLLDGREGRPPA